MISKTLTITTGDSHDTPYVIAEIGVNHDGSVRRALELTSAAASAGANAIKLQLFETDQLMGRAAKLAAYQQAAGESDPITMLRRLELSIDDAATVVAHAHALGLDAIATVFSVDLVDRANSVGLDAFKTASPDIVHKPLLESLAGMGVPIIASTGAATMDEVAHAVRWLTPAHKHLALLHCVSAYPAPDAALEGIAALAHAFALPTGYSDHTPDLDTGARAVRHGAAILEKHLTHDRTAQGPDHAASLEPDQLAEYVRLARAAETQPRIEPTNPTKSPLDHEDDVRTLSRQSVTTTRAVPAGRTLTREDLTIKRPGAGLPPAMLDACIGAVATHDLDADTPITQADVELRNESDTAHAEGVMT